jgi:phytoene desaturase
MTRPRLLVIGAGFAGLAAAIDAARAGAAVTLLEAEASVGGKAGEWREDGFRFDLGPSVFTLPDVVDALFRDAGRERPFDLRPLEPLCRYTFPSGRVWDVSRDVDATLAGLEASERPSYLRALAYARRLYEDAAPTFVRGSAPGMLRLAAYALRHGLAARPGARLPDLLASLGVTGDLATFFLRFATYFGGDPYRVPAVLHNIAWVELGLGVVWPVGGVHGVVRALADLARDLGCEIVTAARVTALERRGGRIRAVHGESGRWEVDGVISAVDHRLTLGWLGRPPRSAPASLSGTVALLGVRGVTPSLSAHNVLFGADYPGEFAALRAGRHPPDPTLYLHLSARGDPDDAPAGDENWFVMANAPAKRPGDGAERAAADAAAAERLRATLAARGLDVALRLAVARDLGPSYLARFGVGGAIYGAAPHGLLATLRRGPRVRGVANLALAGGTVHPGGGIPLALLSGRYAVRALAPALGLAVPAAVAGRGDG